MLVPHEDLERLISSRRTSKPSWFNDQEPDHATVRNAIDVARKAPNPANASAPTYSSEPPITNALPLSPFLEFFFRSINFLS